MTSSIVRPEPRRMIPKSVVDALIADADRQISALEQQAARAIAAADVAEARVGDLGVDERGSAWAAVQLERFVRSLRDDVAVESAAVLAEATARAQAIIDEASYEIAVARDHAEPSELAEVERGLFPPLTRGVRPLPTPAPFVAVAPVEAPAAIQVDLEPVVDRDAAAITPESPSSPDADAVQPDTEFWSDRAEKRRRFPRPHRRTVAFQGTALALLAAAVVVHFS